MLKTFDLFWSVWGYYLKGMESLLSQITPAEFLLQKTHLFSSALLPQFEINWKTWKIFCVGYFR